MTFARGWVLFFLWLPVAWAAWEWRSSGRRASLVLKVATFLSILLALAQPRITIYETKVALAMLVDTSASITPHDLQTASSLADRVEASRGRNWMRVIPFARSTRDSGIEEHPA